MSSKKLPDSTTPIEGAKLARRDGANVPATRTSIVRATSDQISHADRILIDGLEVFANHGVYPEENTLGQKFVVSLVLYADLHAAGESDDLNTSVDYATMWTAICEGIRSSSSRRRQRVWHRPCSHVIRCSWVCV